MPRTSFYDIKLIYNFDSNNTRTPIPAASFLAFLSSSRICAISSLAHCKIAAISLSTSSHVFPACKHTLTRSFPFGTVGHVIGRAFIPRLYKNADSGRG